MRAANSVRMMCPGPKSVRSPITELLAVCYCYCLYLTGADDTSLVCTRQTNDAIPFLSSSLIGDLSVKNNVQNREVCFVQLLLI